MNIKCQIIILKIIIKMEQKEAAEKDFSKEIKPPKGQVYKSWEGDIIAEDEDD